MPTTCNVDRYWSPQHGLGSQVGLPAILLTVDIECFKIKFIMSTETEKSITSIICRSVYLMKEC